MGYLFCQTWIWILIALVLGIVIGFALAWSARKEKVEVAEERVEGFDAAPTAQFVAPDAANPAGPRHREPRPVTAPQPVPEPVEQHNDPRQEAYDAAEFNYAEPTECPAPPEYPKPNEYPAPADYPAAQTDPSPEPAAPHDPSRSVFPPPSEWDQPPVNPNGPRYDPPTYQPPTYGQPNYQAPQYGNDPGVWRGPDPRNG